MSRRRSNSEDQASRTSTPLGRGSINGSPLGTCSLVMSISEDGESEEFDYEHQVGNGGITFAPDDGSSSNSSSSRPSHSIINAQIQSLDGNSHHGERDDTISQHHVLSHTPWYSKKALHEELFYHERSSSLPSERSISVTNGAPIPNSTTSSPRASGYCSTLVFTARRRQKPYLFAFIMSFNLMGMILYTKSYATLHSALDQVTALTHERSQIREYFFNVEQDMQQLQRELLELDKGTIQTGSSSQRVGDTSHSSTNDINGNMAHGDEGLESFVDEMVSLQEKLREGNSQVGSLQKHLQEVSRRDAIQKFGSGVIRVGLELEFPDSEKSKSGIGAPNTLVFEMAPLDLMPHSVYMFLEMVDAGLFDGCSFILNAMHVIKAAPLPYDGSSASQKVKAFTKLGLETVAFREYSSDYPHEQYTVGFAADGSPSFFINTEDNSSEHVGDPCFAKVVSGFDTVHRMQNAPTRNGIFFRRRIGIKAATVL
jgi:cyclophilin family peptidyl-prolyl cis-trans isomerase